ncbi:urea ABC transporter permease subunit UrtC [Candidatus Macondimonas diazotrophica]|jgi:urea transport system permease protein|uniref:Urea ABC transporter permease subunit UrtC n=1 Tax=Candidatus Macondimonas diazotrophica TaxID=2305248 RepID=A0A4Z0F773_9GAMM|nr:urea ABC transporter permease subunit UrtC [Candidatus Macondimonas diazotrophica]NCU00173.1 urea ABC transporter permease subunit UrtC [Candidatus Macondimonas diazotrophica]TFZ81827.1 urea ABC transporter permease subunit UrtC [Candidatus Macondimonas diazotrophica]HBG29783.1 urea ABC transporter permease subunit UrtC [Gammaproteobacteria bacterium]HBG51125.1 urea ABC transporter permease subunit UrtC [Gammaproteobacteria bacterium]
MDTTSLAQPVAEPAKTFSGSFHPAIFSTRGWAIFGLLVLLVAGGIPLSNLALSPDSALHVPDYLVPLLGKFACYALVALAMDLIWGYCGILSLGHGVFFALGGYIMGMHLSQVAAQAGLYRTAFPPFMEFLQRDSLPWFWSGFGHPLWALSMLLLLPGLFAFLFGYLAFRSRIRGVYFSIITQALTYAMMLLFFLNEAGLGGNNGLTDFKMLMGFSLQEPGTRAALFALTVLMLAGAYVLCRYLVRSKLGRVLVGLRDAENRLMFMGYNPLHYKLFVWTLSAVLCAIAGALYVPQVGIINPSELQPANSIEMAVWVAVGGRGTLVGPMLGALTVNGAKSWLTAAYPELWLFFLAAIFIGVTLWLPGGLWSLISRRRGGKA